MMVRPKDVWIMIGVVYAVLWLFCVLVSTWYSIGMAVISYFVIVRANNLEEEIHEVKKKYVEVEYK